MESSEIQKNGEKAEQVLKSQESHIHALFIQTYYINQLKIIEIQEKIYKGMSLPVLKENIIVIYDMLSMYEPGFLKLDLCSIFFQINEMFKIMARAAYIAIDNNYTKSEPLHNFKTFFNNNIDETPNHEKQKSNHERVAYDQPTTNPKQNKKLGGVSLYKQNYGRNIQARENKKSVNNSEKQQGAMGQQQLKKMIEEGLISSEEVKVHLQKEQMEYFIERRKKMGNIQIAQNGDVYELLYQNFKKIENEAKSFLMKSEIGFQLDNFQIMNLESNSSIPSLLASSDKLKKQKAKQLENLFKKLSSEFKLKLRQLSQIYVRKNNIETPYKFEMGVQTLDRWSEQVEQYKSTVKELKRKIDYYKEALQEIEQKRSQHIQFIEKYDQLRAYEAKNKDNQRLIKQLNQKIGYLREINELKGKNLINLFENLSDKSKQQFVKMLQVSHLLQTQAVRNPKRILKTIQKYERNSARISRLSSVTSNSGKNDVEQIIKKQGSAHKKSNLSEVQYQMKVSEIDRIPSSQTSSQQSNDHDAQINLMSCLNLGKPRNSKQYPNKKSFRCSSSSGNVDRGTDQKIIDFVKEPRQQIVSSFQSEVMEDMPFRQFEKQIRENKVACLNINIDRIDGLSQEIEPFQFPFLKPGKVIKNKVEQKPKKIRQSLQQCFEIESKSRSRIENTQTIQSSEMSIKQQLKEKRGIKKKYKSQQQKIPVKGKEPKKNQHLPNEEPISKPIKLKKLKSDIADQVSPKAPKLYQRRLSSSKDEHAIYPELPIKQQPLKPSYYTYLKQIPNQQNQKINMKRTYSTNIEAKKKLNCEYQQVVMLARRSADLDEFKEKLKKLHAKVCSSGNCIHLETYINNFEKYRKNGLKKHSIKLSIHNIQRII